MWARAVRVYECRPPLLPARSCDGIWPRSTTTPGRGPLPIMDELSRPTLWRRELARAITTYALWEKMEKARVESNAKDLRYALKA